uniref:Uncharacterized protein n=1 Tax=Siphoviridae sp. ctWhx86 TaxID=2826362 RepID=A0A8S5QPZ9_9CAUD|nr:MAG TPA: hypothetical protein [Siphoviridae sp. ctWhx86]
MHQEQQRYILQYLLLNLLSFLQLLYIHHKSPKILYFF